MTRIYGQREIDNWEFVGTSNCRGNDALLADAPSSFSEEQDGIWTQFIGALKTNAALQYITKLAGKSGNVQEAASGTKFGLAIPTLHKYKELTGMEVVGRKMAISGASLDVTFQTSPEATSLTQLKNAQQVFMDYKSQGYGMVVRRQISVYAAFEGDIVTQALLDDLETNLTSYIAHRRAQLGNDTRFVLVMPATGSTLDAQRILDAQQIIKDIAAADDKIVWVNIDNLTKHTDNLHYGAVGQAGMGYAVAEAAHTMQNVTATDAVFS